MTADHLTLEARMAAFALTFPSAANAPGAPLWDDRHRAAFLAWASAPWWP